jgi:5'-deoxynucleotidase YfbR-like HD superfamily hydrolase
LPDSADLRKIAKFVFELGQLRQEARHGWLRICESPESVAEHTHRAACLGDLLAIVNDFDPCEWWKQIWEPDDA